MIVEFCLLVVRPLYCRVTIDHHATSSSADRRMPRLADAIFPTATERGTGYRRIDHTLTGGAAS
jgi:hypothetical protein